MLDNNEDTLGQLYSLYMTMFIELLEQGYRESEIAAITMKMSMEIYKTILDDDGYNTMIDYLSDNRDKISPLE